MFSLNKWISSPTPGFIKFMAIRPVMAARAVVVKE
jgi:hypothetical protein